MLTYDHSTPANASTIPCPGWHNDAWRYEEPDDPDEHDKGGVPGEPVWCYGCYLKIRSTITFLPHAVRALEVEIEEATDITPERVSGSRARTLHEHQAQALLIDEIHDVLTQWEDDVREQRGLTGRLRDMRQVPGIEAASVFLLAHLDWILTKALETDQPYGLVRAFVDRTHRLDRRAMRLTHQDEAKPEECIGVPCKAKHCNMRALVRNVDKRGADAGEIKCENCGATMSIGDYVTWAKQWAIYEHKRLTESQREELGRQIAAFERVSGAT